MQPRTNRRITVLTTEFKHNTAAAVFVFRPTGRTMTLNGVGVQEIEVTECPAHSELSYRRGQVHAPTRATRADVIAEYFA